MGFEDKKTIGLINGDAAQASRLRTLLINSGYDVPFILTTPEAVAGRIRKERGWVDAIVLGDFADNLKSKDSDVDLEIFHLLQNEFADTPIILTGTNIPQQNLEGQHMRNVQVLDLGPASGSQYDLFLVTMAQVLAPRKERRGGKEEDDQEKVFQLIGHMKVGKLEVTTNVKIATLPIEPLQFISFNLQGEFVPSLQLRVKSVLSKPGAEGRTTNTHNKHAWEFTADVNYVSADHRAQLERVRLNSTDPVLVCCEFRNSLTIINIYPSP